MNKLLGVGSNSRVLALSLLLILAGFAISAPTPCRAANPLVGYQFVSKIELADPLSSEIRVEDVKIQNVLRLSYFYVNEEDSPVPFNVSQGKIVWQPRNLTVQSATVVDNLGNSFTPLNYNGSIMNPYHEVTIEPRSMYNLSLIVVLMPGALYSSAFQAWRFGTCLRSKLPIDVSITLPSNFSVLFYTVGAKRSRDENYKVLTWRNSLQQTLNVSVVFLPFLYNPETKSLKFLMDIPSIFPILTNIKATLTHEFESISEYNGLKVPQIFKLPVLYPASGKDIQVVSVYDTEGQCNKTPNPLSEPNDTNRGSYFDDPKNREVIVYPRAEIYENHYAYSVSVTFDFGGDVPVNVTFGPLMPYEGSSIFNIVNVNATGDWKQNLTQNTIVEFQLPQGTQPYLSNDYTINYEDGRYIVRFVNASSELTSGTWEIRFAIIRLRNFFRTEVSSIVLLAAIIIVMLVLRFGRPATLLKLKWKLHLGNTAGKLISYLITPGIWVALIAYEVNILGDWFWDVIPEKKCLTILLIVQGGLMIAISVLLWKFEQQTTGEASHPYVV